MYSSVDDATTTDVPVATEMPEIALFHVPPDDGRFAYVVPPVA